MKLQLKILFWITVINYIAQVPYSLHQYHSLLPSVRGLILMSITFFVFIFSFYYLYKGSYKGYIGMIVFLSCEFIFYVLNLVGSTIAGYGWFFQLRNPNPLLFTVFLIGYINLFAAGYFLLYLLKNKLRLVIE